MVVVVARCDGGNNKNEMWCKRKFKFTKEVLRVQGVRGNSQRNKVRMRMKEFKFTRVKTIILRLFLNQCRI